MMHVYNEREKQFTYHASFTDRVIRLAATYP